MSLDLTPPPPPARRPRPGTGTSPGARPDPGPVARPDAGLAARPDDALPPQGDAPFRPWRVPVRVRLLLAANTAAAGAYLAWWLVPGRVGSPVLFAALATAEVFTLAQVLGLWWAVWRTRIFPPPPVVRWPTIDVFIPTCGEPVEVLRPTVAAAVAMRGRHRTMVLDDACRPEVERLAHELGAGYLPRRDRTGAKAGNLNHAFRCTDGELVAVFDADHVPHPEFLTRLVGYFNDGRVAFVQTPQHYGNSLASRVARGANQQQGLFYGPILRGRNGLGSVFCCGTNVLLRRRALADVGGFDEVSVTEDFVTSMRLKRRGWRSVYYPYLLATGLGPESLAAYFGQQFRWARGSVGALVSGEPLRRGLRAGPRIQYLLATTFYLVGLATCVYVSLPILYLLFGLSAFSEEAGSYVFLYAPYLIGGLATIRWGLGRQLRLEHLQFTFGSFPVYAAAALCALARTPASFRITPKGADGRTRPPALAGVTVAVLAATVVSIVVGPVLQGWGARTVTNVSWAVVNILLLWPVAALAVREALGWSTACRVPAAAAGPVGAEREAA